MSSPAYAAIRVLIEHLQRDKNLSLREIYELLQKEHQSDLTFSLSVLIDEVTREEKRKRNEILNELFPPQSSSDITIPINIFSSHVGSLEALVFYLHHDLHLSFADISTRLARKSTTVRTAYLKAKEKGQETLTITKSSLSLPLSLFVDRTLTVFERATVALKQQGYSFSEIARFLGKDQRNVWSTHERALTKLDKGGIL